MEKLENSSETFQANSSLKDTKINESFLNFRDFNNIETADKKLIINKSNNYFWVHDDVLANSCDYFNSIIFADSNLKKDLKENKNEISIIELNLPFEDLENTVFDLLLWIYTKDYKKIKKYVKFPNYFMKLIALSCYLKMKPKFFDGLLTKINFTWTKDIFTNVYWSRTFFNFEVLEKICNIMKCPLYVKVYALLSWVQNGINKEIISVSELGNKDEYKKYTTDCYLVRNYMSKNKLSEKMEFSSTKEIFTNFNDNLLALDCKPIINDFMYFGDKKLNCLACDKEFSSLGMVIDNITCKGKSYHPVINKNEKECLHNNCTFKYKEGYYSCCHKVVNTENSKKGCVYAEGKHVFIFN